MTGPADPGSPSLSQSPSDRLTAALAADAPSILRFLERRLGLQEAPDALADVMVTAWRRVDVLPVPAQEARMWLFGVARNVVSDHARAARRRVRLADKVRALTSAADLTTPATDASTEVQDAVARLRPELAEIVRLVHWDGFSLTEAAQLTGVTPSTARGRYQRARQVLRAALTPAIAR